MKALPAILMSVGALIAVGAPGLAIARHMHLRSAGLVGRAGAAESDLALFALFSVFAMALGLLLIAAGNVMRRTRKAQEQVAAQRKARRAAERARPTHA